MSTTIEAPPAAEANLSATADTPRMVTREWLAEQLDCGVSTISDMAAQGVFPGTEDKAGIRGKHRFPFAWSRKLQDLIDIDREARRRGAVARERERLAKAAGRELSATASALTAIDEADHALARARLRGGGLCGIDRGTAFRLKSGLRRLIQHLDALELTSPDETAGGQLPTSSGHLPTPHM
jgi:hypothetical protein